jgi:lipid A 4'-phosphatase
MNSQWLLRALLRFDTIGLLICIAFFISWPQFDIYFSQYFYDANNNGFFLRDHFITQFVYSLTHFVGAAIFLSLITMIIASWVTKKDSLIKRRKALIFLLSACLIGPGLMVNLILKDNWGRPRPRQTIEFGGQKKFEPPLSPSFECSKCYSFVSGHASIGFYFFSLALLTRKRRWLLLPAIAGITIGSARIVQGAHFFSDVIFSGWVIWFTTLLLYHLFFKPERKPQLAVAPS